MPDNLFTGNLIYFHFIGICSGSVSLLVGFNNVRVGIGNRIDSVRVGIVGVVFLLFVGHVLQWISRQRDARVVVRIDGFAEVDGVLQFLSQHLSNQFLMSISVELEILLAKIPQAKR